MKFDYAKHYNVLIWGLGTELNKKCEEILQLKNQVVIVGFADNRYEEINDKIRSGEILNGFLNKDMPHLVYSPNEVSELYTAKEIDGVIIATSATYYDEIKSQIESECMVPVIEFPELNWKCVSELSNDNVAYSRFGLNAYRLSDIIYKKTALLGSVIAYTKEKDVIIDELNGENRVEWFDTNIREIILPDADSDTYVIKDEVCPLARLWADSNYAHFMLEILPKIIFLEEEGYKGKYILQRTSWANEILKYIPLAEERIIWLDELSSISLLKNMICVESSNMRDERNISQIRKWVFNICERINNEPKQYPKRVYVKRIGTRRLVNYEKLIKEYGFFEFVPEEYSIIEQWRFFMNAEVVVSSHGAAMANCIFLKEGSSVVETFCKEWISACFAEIYRSFNLKYHAVPELSFQFGGETGKAGQLIEEYAVDELMLSLAIRDSIGQ